MTAQPTADPVMETIGYFGVLLRMDDGIRAAHHTLIVNDELRAVSGQVRTEADRLGTALLAEGATNPDEMAKTVVEELLLRSILDDNADVGTALAYTLSEMTGVRYFVVEGFLDDDDDPAVSDLHRLEAASIEEGQERVVALLGAALDDAEEVALGCSPDDPPSELCDGCLLDQGLACIEELIARGMLQVVVQTPGVMQECEVVNVTTDERKLDLRIREQFGKEVRSERPSRAKRDRSAGGGMVH